MRSIPRLLFAACALTGAVTASGGAGAAERAHVRLTYEAEKGCPDQRAFRDLVAARLGYDPFVESAPAGAHVRLALRGATMVSRLEVSEGGRVHGTRELSAPSAECPALATSTAIALSVLLDPLGEQQAGPPPAPLPTAPPSPPEPAPSSASGTGLVRVAAPPPRAAGDAPIRLRPPPSSPRREVLVGAGLGLSLGQLPGLTAGLVTARAGFGVDPFSVWLEGRAGAGRTVDLGGGDRVRTTLLEARLAACAKQLCLTAGAGTVDLTTVAGSATLTRSFAATLGGRASVPIHLRPWLDLVPSLELSGALARAEVKGTSTFETSPLIVVSELALAARPF